MRRIAAAKAGIFKEGRPVVLGRQCEAQGDAELLRQAEAQSCPVTRAGDVVTVNGLEMGFSDWCRQRVQITIHKGLDKGLEDWQNGVAGLSLRLSTVHKAPANAFEPGVQQLNHRALPPTAVHQNGYFSSHGHAALTFLCCDASTDSERVPQGAW